LQTFPNSISHRAPIEAAQVCELCHLQSLPSGRLALKLIAQRD
jgi:hypothetical protein